MQKKSGRDVRWRGRETDRMDEGAKRTRPDVMETETDKLESAGAAAGKRRGNAGIWLDRARRGVPYSGASGARSFPPSAGEHAREDLPSITANPLSQAASSPKLPHSFDETETHARDAPRRVLSCVLFRGVVTPGLGI